METPIYISLSRMTALERQMDVVANNVANASSTGFKQQRVLFTEFLDKPALGEQISLVHDRATVRNMSPGPLSVTNNPLDMALNGGGYFVVDTLNGPHYTRAGRFQLDAKGEIVDSNGLPVLDANNRPITMPNGTTDIQVHGDGSVFSNVNPTSAVGKINIVSFADDQQMSPVGGGLFVTSQPVQPAPATTKITQGVVEESNVQPVVEMTYMISILRQYQGIQKIVEAEHTRQRNMIQKLGRQA